MDTMMTRAIGHVPSDGNGWPGGVRLSWPALSVMIAVVALVFTVAGFTRARDIELLSNRQEALREQITKDQDHLRESLASLSQQVHDNATILRRVEINQTRVLQKIGLESTR